MQSYLIGEKSPDPGGLAYRFLLKSMIPIGFLLLLVQSLAATLRALMPFLCGVLSSAVQSRKPAEHAAECNSGAVRHRLVLFPRSEERRVGNACACPCRSRWSPSHQQKKSS